MPYVRTRRRQKKGRKQVLDFAGLKRGKAGYTFSNRREQELNEKKCMTKAEKQNVIEKLWLNHYYDTLFAKGLISESDRNRMRNRINQRRPRKGLER